MIDDLLGPLTTDAETPGRYIGTVDCGGRIVPLHIDTSGYPIDECIALARLAVSSLGTLEERAKNCAVEELLETYNECWREYNEWDGEKWLDVSNPAIDSQQFKDLILLNTVYVDGNELFTLWFDDGGLFEGHSIEVTSFDGPALSDFHATLVG
jgi:hypothetical protein